MAVRSAGTFATILAVGVLIVLIYQWSGDSIIVLIMSLLTLFALLALWDRKPWQVVPDDEDWSGNRGRRDPNANFDNRVSDDTHDSNEIHDGNASHDSSDTGTERQPHEEADRVDQVPAHDAPPARPLTEDSPLWRCRFDIGVDQDGVSGLALGEREPRHWPWDLVTSAGVGWSAAIAEGDRVEERVGLHLGLTGEPQAQLMFGAGQHPGAVLGAVRRGIQAARIERSRFHSLSPAERTRQLANALSPDPINLTKDILSPELLYQDARRTLLTNRTLRRVSRDASAEQILVAFEQLLAAHETVALDDQELGPMGAAADRGDSETVYLGADRAAETRGYRLAFIQHGGDDHLLGLLAIDDASDWDGQTVGSGLTTVSLDPPTYR